VKRRLEERKGGWDGIVLDLSALPASQSLDVLEGVRGSAKQAIK
jgi:hypothetical protein